MAETSRAQTQMHKALDEYQVVLAMEGDERAFQLLYKRWHVKFLRVAYRCLGDAEEAKDVVQAAAMIIARDIHKLKDASLFGAWAYTIIRRRAVDHIRSAQAERSLRSEFQDEQATINVRPAEDAFSLRQAMKTLPERDRLLLRFFYADGLTITEMAAVMNLPMGTVKSRLFSARNKLKRIYDLDPKGDQDE